MNKYISLISTAALCIGFAACDEVEESLSTPQTNPQETIFNADNLTVTPNSEMLNLQSLYDQGEEAKVASFTVTDFPVASTMDFKMQIAKDASFDNPAEVGVTVDSLNNVYVRPFDLDQAYYKTVTKNPVPAKVNVRFVAYAVNGTEEVLIGGKDKFYGVGQLDIKPFDPKVVIEEAYFLEANGEEVKFAHSPINVYDDPMFSTVIDITVAQAEAGYKWCVKSQAGKYYAPAEEGNAGELVESATVPAEMGVINQAGPHMIKINMENHTYEVTLAIDQLYTPGNSNGWNQAASQKLLTNNYMDYYGFVHLNGEFKFSSQPDWGGVNYGSTGVEGQLTADGGAGNLSASEDALYWVHVNLGEMTYTLTKVESLGLIGGFNGWGSQANLTPSADFLVWTGKVTMSKGDEFKFRANDDWGINLGGELNELVYDGANLVSEESGTFDVILDLSNAPYFCAMVAE